MFKLPLYILPIWLEVREATAQTNFNQSSHLNQYCLRTQYNFLYDCLFPSFFFLLLIPMLALSAVHDFDYYFLNQLMFIVC